MKLHIIPAIAVLALLMPGCGLYKKYEHTEPESARAALFTDSPDSVLAPLATRSWRTLFTDTILTRWIETGLERNTDLRSAYLNVVAADARLQGAKLGFLPSASLQVQGSASNSQRSFSIGPQAQWEIDIFGRQRNLMRGAGADRIAAEAYSQAVRTSLVAALASSYYNLMMLDEQLSISERTLANWEENIRVMEALKRAGRTNEAAVLQARANRMRVQNSVNTLRQQIYEQENAVRSLLLAPDMEVTRDSLSSFDFPEFPQEGLPLETLSNRPDVRQAEWQLASAFYSVNVARAAFYPSLSITGSAIWQTRSGSVTDPGSWITNALGNLLAPLFSRGSNMANLKVSKATQEQARIEYEQRLVDAAMEVNNALSQWRTARQRLEIDREQITALQGAVRSTKLLMRHTNTNYLEVLTAQQRLLEAELTAAADRFDQVKAVVALYHALGGGAK
ncbi:MAG: TolC family protein [Muribaculaceae bacterium]|nr:TolC family protein [Muribaculaceae bacterium]